MGLLRDLVRRSLVALYKPRHWHLRPGTLDARIFRAVILGNEYRLPRRFHPDDVILDIGGHIGSFALAALRRGAGKVITFEPEPGNFALLRDNLAPFGDRASVRPVAVWGNDVPAGGLHLANLLDPRNTGASRIGDTGVQVQAVTFDDLIEQRVRLVKLDCEGAEWPILTTSRKLHLVEAFCGEYHLGDLAPPGASVELLQTTLGQAGFRVEIVPYPKSPFPAGLFFGTRM